MAGLVIQGGGNIVLISVGRGLLNPIAQYPCRRRLEPAIDIQGATSPPAAREWLVTITAARGIGTGAKHTAFATLIHDTATMKTVGIENQQIPCVFRMNSTALRFDP